MNPVLQNISLFNDDSFVFIDQDTNNNIGYISSVSKDGYISGFNIYEKYRGHGLSYGMMKALCDKVKYKHKKLWLMVYRFNLPAIKTYLKSGFVFSISNNGRTRRRVLTMEKSLQ
jgi:RimJ/RimL family protein N-acetyltransferase